MEDFKVYQEIAKKVRRTILEMIYRTKSPHIGSSFSIVELLTALYFKILKVDAKNQTDPDRDRFLLSKGHGVPALYPILAEKGFIKPESLDDFGKFNSDLGGHPDRTKISGVEASTGSLGHGLPISLRPPLSLSI